MRWNLPPFTVAQVLAWAQAHRARMGRWPNEHSGPVAEAPDENWQKINQALKHGHRGLPGGGSLSKLLAGRLGARTRAALPRLTVALVLAWADKARTGDWPGRDSGAIKGAGGETWQAVDMGLKQGARGFKGGSSLSAVLRRYRRIRGRDGSRPTGRVPDAARTHHALELRRQGLTHREIARQLGTSADIVCRLLAGSEERVPGGKATDRERKRAVELRRQGLTYAEVGERLGRPAASAYNLVRSSGEAMPDDLPENRGCKPDVARRRLATRLRAKGLTLQEIGDRLGCTRQNVAQLLKAAREVQT